MAPRADPVLDRALAREVVDLDHEALQNDRAPDLADEDRDPAAPGAPDPDHPLRVDDPARTRAIKAETLAEEVAPDRDPAPDPDNCLKNSHGKRMQILVKYKLLQKIRKIIYLPPLFSLQLQSLPHVFFSGCHLFATIPLFFVIVIIVNWLRAALGNTLLIPEFLHPTFSKIKICNSFAIARFSCARK